ncbi:ABC transporter permease [Clostridium tetani]|uniref:ABC transporter permease n=1 Tax=Clostridium tetani TaxID=1513 RepID=UPI0003C0D93D|nr:ABC transporter permease [Clostridium tetani]CDI49994.1 putative ABC transporter-associated permease [Clostridium tetani 12124569]
MLINMLQNYKKNLFSVILLIIGYFIGILSLSIGTSVIKDVREYSLDSTSGNVKNSVISRINTNNISDLSYNNISKVLTFMSKDVEVQLLNFGNIPINNNENYTVQLVPIINSKKSDWHIPIIKGKYFSNFETSSNKKVVIIGKEVEKEIFPKGITKDSIITIYGEEYKVIGVSGRNTRKTQWDRILYIPFKSLPKKIKANFNERIINTTDSYEISLFLRKNQGQNIELQNLVDRTFSNIIKDDNNLEIKFEIIAERDGNRSRLFNSILGTIIISGMILIVVVINVINLSLFWIFNRRQEICVKKVLGAPDILLISSILLEMIIIAIISTILAIFTQKLIFYVYNEYFIIEGISLEISMYNWLIAISVSIICGLISSIFPIKEMLKMEPAEALKPQ